MQISFGTLILAAIGGFLGYFLFKNNKVGKWLGMVVGIILGGWIGNITISTGKAAAPAVAK